MKQILLITVTLVFILFTNNVNAQKTRKHKGNKGQKTVVHKGKGGKKTAIHKGTGGKTTVVYKGKKGNTSVAHKGKHGNVHAYKKHKRVKRTRIVHHHYRHLPRRGAIVTRVHSSALTIKFGGVGFRFHSGIWYKPHKSKWIISRPAYGIRIKVLPVGYRKIVIGPSTYYYYYGTYYVNVNNEYEVIKAPIDAEIDSLPDGYNTIDVNGNEYYELDGIYYLPSLNEVGEEILVVVKNPTL